jgi:hypothetical protein
MNILLFTFLSCLFLIIITIFTSLAIIYSTDISYCQSNPIPYCYNNWGCDTAAGFVNLSQKVVFNPDSPVNVCSNPITEENFTKYSYTGPKGNPIDGNPSAELNIWYDTNCINSPDEQHCPKYKIGDIYWSACYGGKNSQFYSHPIEHTF